MARTVAASEHSNFDAYTLIVMSESDRVDGKSVRDLVDSERGDRVRWVQLESNACMAELI